MAEVELKVSSLAHVRRLTHGGSAVRSPCTAQNHDRQEAEPLLSIRRG